ncbi:MAG: hypothetical protein DI539_15570 [Flavobacterium psychrophilum]|nr:MAG: hypothetical protein DI539_15570 [Flavobacterium psychrophilum]
MIQQNPAQIFKSHTRGLAEDETHRMHATFNINTFNGDLRHSFGALTALNDETLAANKKITKSLANGITALVLPLVGAAECTFEGGGSHVIVPGEAFIYHKNSNADITIRNPYEENLINYLYINFSSVLQSEVLLPKGFLLSQADLTVKNTFHKLFECFQNGLSAQMGIFNGRAEVRYKTSNKSNGVFAFVISGAFEIQGCLIEERDGLALWDIDEMEMEALSENAILLLIEAPLNG